MRFAAIDIETANADMASVCQIGIAQITDGILSAEWKSYVDPQDDFDGINVSIHSIDEAVVSGAPTFDEVAERIFSELNGHVVVTHTHFDRVSLLKVSEKYNVAPPQCRWLDSARVARRAWLEIAHCGYGLANVCNRLGYQFKHHDALEDAKAAAHIMLSAIDETGLDLEGWTKRVRQPLDLSRAEPIARDGDPNGPLHGEVLVFTGSLQVPRREAADMAASAGCCVAQGVTRETTVLIVGDQDIRHLAGHCKSSKHRKAEALIQKGQLIRILTESDFQDLVGILCEG